MGNGSGRMGVSQQVANEPLALSQRAASGLLPAIENMPRGSVEGLRSHRDHNDSVEISQRDLSEIDCDISSKTL